MLEFILNHCIIMLSIAKSYYAESGKIIIQIRRKNCSIYRNMSRKLQYLFVFSLLSKGVVNSNSIITHNILYTP